ncbi:SRPBCC domain-containing protein [Flavobacterium sp. Sd200]|uniref:SRPBCC domain-containing protein n=1 Tax=Flavobacterium sp. Sd200 TaxID=2692211 RepID=UPI001368ED5B|nr:SRPBCC domain-containing protein [Flavobacterium sp. Sd200]MXN90241.1 SRPBCC domain-containing protein [Flavobacterium sp. Sd200]
MQNQSYNTTIKTLKPAQKVFNKINETDKWWTANFEGSNSVLGDTFKVTFGDTYMELKVVELIENEKITWLVTNSHKHFVNKTNEWNDTTINFKITEEGDTTTVMFEHIGLENTLECYEICCNGWNTYLQSSLKDLINTGTGLPDKKV